MKFVLGYDNPFYILGRRLDESNRTRVVETKRFDGH